MRNPTTLGANFYVTLKHNFLGTLPDSFLLFGVILIFAINLYIFRKKKKQNLTFSFNSTILNFFGILLILVIALILTCWSLTIIPDKDVYFTRTYVQDYFSIFFKIIILIVSILYLIGTYTLYVKADYISFEFFTIFLMSVLASTYLVSAINILSIFLILELNSLCVFVLLAFHKNSNFSIEASLKYFLLGILATAIMMFGFSILYVETGTLVLREICIILLQIVQDDTTSNFTYIVLVFAGICILIGFLFKLTAVPFHIWASNVYEGAPFILTFYLMTVPKIAMLGLFLRVTLTGLDPILNQVKGLILVSILASMVIPIINALSHTQIKKILIFSSINHVGFILIGFFCGTLAGIASTIFYMLAYMLAIINIFYIILNFPKKEFSENTLFHFFSELKYLYATHPIMAYCFFINLLSIGGVPPLMGFYAKIALFKAALDRGYMFLVFIAVVASILSIYLYVKLGKEIFFEKVTEEELKEFVKTTAPVNKLPTIIVICLTTFLVFFLFFSKYVILLLEYPMAAFLA